MPGAPPDAILVTFQSAGCSEGNSNKQLKTAHPAILRLASLIFAHETESTEFGSDMQTSGGHGSQGLGKSKEVVGSHPVNRKWQLLTEEQSGMSSGHTQSPDQPGRLSRANLGHLTLPEPGDDVSLSQMPQLCWRLECELGLGCLEVVAEPC